MRRRATRLARADAIAKAALSLFVEEGVQGATTRAIARRARTTEGNLYRYFPSKQELVRRVITGSLVEFGEFLAGALEGVAGPRERLGAFVRAYLDYAFDHPMEHALIVEAHNRSLAGIPDEILRPRRLLADILADGVAQGVFEAGEPRVVAPFIAGGLARYVRVASTLDRPERRDEVAVQLTSAVERLVGTRRDRPETTLPAFPSTPQPRPAAPAAQTDGTPRPPEA